MKTPALSDFKGFTLVELMIVISVIAAISGFVIPSFSNYIHNQNLRQARDKLVTDIRSIQNRALTGVNYGEDQRFWGIKFIQGDSVYYYFTVDTSFDTNSDGSFSTGELAIACNGVNTGAAEKSKPFLNDVIIISDETCMYFSFHDGGVPFVDAPISLGYFGEADCMEVSVNLAGMVSSPADFQSCP